MNKNVKLMIDFDSKDSKRVEAVAEIPATFFRCSSEEVPLSAAVVGPVAQDGVKISVTNSGLPWKTSTTEKLKSCPFKEPLFPKRPTEDQQNVQPVKELACKVRNTQNSKIYVM